MGQMPPTVEAFLDTHHGVPKCRMVRCYQELEDECRLAGDYAEAARYARKKRDYMELAHMWQMPPEPGSKEALDAAVAVAEATCSGYSQQAKAKAERNYDQRLVWAFVASVGFLLCWWLF